MLRRNPAKLDFDLVLFRIPNSRSEFRNYLKEVLEFYADRGIPEDKSMFIAKNYEIKVRMLREFQKGKSISLYREQKKYKNSLHSDSIPHD